MESVAGTLPAFERIKERKRVRTLRMQRHLVFAGVAGALLGSMLAWADTVPELALVPVLVGLMVRSIARGADAGFGHIWGWIYAEPMVTTNLDRHVGQFIDFFRPPVRTYDTGQEVKVRPLDPFHDG